MFPTTALVSFCLLAVAYGQHIGTQMAENHPALTTQTCNASGVCTSANTAVVLDSNWRWTHQTTSTTNCYTGNTWDATLCPDPATCVANCAIDGADYTNTYGITTSGDALTLKFVTGANIGSRVYLLSPDGSNYQLFQLLNQEFTFTVDMSHLDCGLNGALYFTEMDADGGMARFPTNLAGAKYGTGYCDAQCPHDLKFINGMANVIGWTPDADDPNSGMGQFGTCCNEMDIWEANVNAAAYTPHACSVVGQTECLGSTQCGDGTDRQNGVCDKDGCDFNSFRLGNKSFLGPGLTVDTNQPITVVTQFISSNNASTGTLSEIRRLYVQNGVVIQNSNTNLAGISPPVNSITDAFCTQQKAAVGDPNTFEARGGLQTIGAALQKGMVLAMSLWDDHEADMLWLDSNYPLNASATAPGVARGNCSATSGDPNTVQSTQPNAFVIFSNIKTGPLGSTFSTSTPPVTTTVGTTTAPSTTTVSAPTGTAGTIPEFDQCGGINWTGSGTCIAPFTCQVQNPFFFQCLPAN